jgi:hypothetical protein
LRTGQRTISYNFCNILGRFTQRDEGLAEVWKIFVHTVTRLVGQQRAIQPAIPGILMLRELEDDQDRTEHLDDEDGEV